MSRLASTPGAAFPFYSQKQSFAAAEDPTAGNPELKTSSLWANKFLMEAAAPEGTALPLAHPQPGTRPRVCGTCVHVWCVCVCVCVHACASCTCACVVCARVGVGVSVGAAGTALLDQVTHSTAGGCVSYPPLCA